MATALIVVPSLIAILSFAFYCFCLGFNLSSLLCLIPLLSFPFFFYSSPEKFPVSEIKRGGLLPSWIISYRDRWRTGRYIAGSQKSQIAWSKGKGEDIKAAGSWERLDSHVLIWTDLKECGKVMQSHFGTLVSCARLASPQCSELFSMFGSQSSRALLLWWRALTKSVSRDGSIFPAFLRAGPNGAVSLEFEWWC